MKRESFHKLTASDRVLWQPDAVRKQAVLWCAYGYPTAPGPPVWHMWPEIPKSATAHFHALMLVVRYDGIQEEQVGKVCPACLHNINTGRKQPCDAILTQVTISRMTDPL